MSGVVAGILGTLTELPKLFLTLGGVVLYDQEVPASLQGGGAQTLAEHKYPGGTRTIDTFGPDDEDLKWEGTFLDVQAETRCHQLDAIRRAGLQVPLTWSSFSYLVVVRRFTWDYQRPWQIPYQISCSVVQDILFAPPANTTNTPSQQATADTSTASSNATALTNISYSDAG
jgi:hypothetical protein